MFLCIFIFYRMLKVNVFYKTKMQVLQILLSPAQEFGLDLAYRLQALYCLLTGTGVSGYGSCQSGKWRHP